MALTAGTYRIDTRAQLDPGPAVITGLATPSSGTIDITTGFATVLAFVANYSEASGTAEIIWTASAGVVTMTGSDKECSFIGIGLI